MNDRLQTTNSNIYAAGDICSPFQFTHAADFMARTVIRNALFFGRAKVGALTIPWCTYTEPEIAHVGLYEKQAREQGIEVDTFTRKLDEVDRSILEGRTDGLVRVHVPKGKDKIIGATIVASHAGDMISEITLAMTHIALKAVKENQPMPDGAIIVKENYAKDKEKLMAVTPMFLKKGYNPDGGDWFWAKYGPDGKIMASGKVDSCIQCHQTQKDWLFTETE